MAKMIRCNRCFAPKDHKDDVCEFCGLDPKEEQVKKEEFEKMLLDIELDFLEQKVQEKREAWIDLPLDERIRKYSGVGTSSPMMGMFGKKSS